MNTRTTPNIGTQVSSEGTAAAYFTPIAAPAVLLSVLVSNTGADQFIQVWDATAKSDSGAVLLFSFPIPADKPASLDTPIACVRGIYLRASSALVSTAGELAADTDLGDDCLFLSRHI